MNKFNTFNTRFKQILKIDNDYEIANILNIPASSYSTMKKSNNIPYEKVISYCEIRQIDIVWILDIKTNKEQI